MVRTWSRGSRRRRVVSARSGTACGLTRSWNSTGTSPTRSPSTPPPSPKNCMTRVRGSGWVATRSPSSTTSARPTRRPAWPSLRPTRRPTARRWQPPWRRRWEGTSSSPAWRACDRRASSLRCGSTKPARAGARTRSASPGSSAASTRPRSVRWTRPTPGCTARRRRPSTRSGTCCPRSSAAPFSMRFCGAWIPSLPRGTCSTSITTSRWPTNPVRSSRGGLRSPTKTPPPSPKAKRTCTVRCRWSTCLALRTLRCRSDGRWISSLCSPCGRTPWTAASSSRTTPTTWMTQRHY
mmetsp:Transcript_106023/g.276906  ORF Transcript_106023/g.276906 Transcript_106023/m.276906 type:complete len:294 (-) Transcript_106023:1498-2379(-)